MSLLEQRSVSFALVQFSSTEEYSQFCPCVPVILLSNSKQLCQFQQNRLTKFGYGLLATAFAADILTFELYASELR